LRIYKEAVIQVFMETVPCYREYRAHLKGLTNDRATKIYKGGTFIKFVKSHVLGCLQTAGIWRQCWRVARGLAGQRVRGGNAVINQLQCNRTNKIHNLI
jgi:hypothetical protein